MSPGKWGIAVLWGVALAAGWGLARGYLRGRFTAMLEDTEKYAVFPESEPLTTNFDQPMDITMTQPIFPQNMYYNPAE